MPLLRRKLRRIDAHLPLALLGLLIAKPTPLSIALGAVPVVLGIAIRVWASGFLEKDGGLCVAGPYRYVRHPLYLGSLLAALGFAFMMNVIWGWVIILPAFLLLCALQVVAEERHLRSLYGDAHAEFARVVPLLLPLPGKNASSHGGRWEMARALHNREHYHVIATLLLAVLFFAKWRLGW
jgi:protein-S-isoprenylcysteine O-methyltransferase Ste14